MKPTDHSPVVSQRVADLLAERILSGELKPGERIKQDVLTEELNISRIPVRDALRILESRGLVSLRANAGARVTSMTTHDMEVSYKIRERLEPMLLEESVPHLTDGDIEEMRDILDRLDAVTDVEAYLPLDRQFHFAAYRRHNAPQLAQIVERLWDTTQPYRRAYTKLSLKNGARIMQTEHKLLFGAFERREVETAQATLVMHIRRTRIGLVNYGYLIGAAPVVRTSTF
ncbi:GntR family transcriptional regulator [Sphingomonas naphthae]|uniref:GntR family transcriptional regulator n=1 Tax=Sphingomonas naphthae TaxID=1813468 RepID=A0ABY7TMJ4_9SPHN|nr:GntR family transcriptional regulator [Sphingomonas naphthae]WCT74437.1 GntR family transcriptional regulator [Sphingomonas naphthae]